MDSIEDRIKRVGEDPKQLSAAVTAVQMVKRIGGIILIIFSLRVGREKIELVYGGVRSFGTIVDYKQADWTTPVLNGSRTSHKPFMPIVEFQVDGKPMHFQDSVGSKVAGGLMQQVPILYDKEKPEVAMIDRPVMNWFPWGPMLFFGAVICWSGFRRRRRH